MGRAEAILDKISPELSEEIFLGLTERLWETFDSSHSDKITPFWIDADDWDEDWEPTPSSLEIPIFENGSEDGEAVELARVHISLSLREDKSTVYLQVSKASLVYENEGLGTLYNVAKALPMLVAAPEIRIGTLAGSDAQLSTITTAGPMIDYEHAAITKGWKVFCSTLLAALKKDKATP